MRAVNQTDLKRAAELIVTFMDDDTDFEALVAYTMAEFEPDLVISAIIALLVGTCRGFGPTGTKILADTLNDLRDQQEEPWPTR